jgi:hypothetical protein
MCERWRGTSRLSSPAQALVRLCSILALGVGACGITERTVDELDDTGGGTAGANAGHPSTAGAPHGQGGTTPSANGGTTPFISGGFGPIPSQGGNALGAGGRAVAGAAPVDFCSNPAVIPASCPTAEPVVGGAGGANTCGRAPAAGGASDWANVGGDAGMAGAADPPALPRLLIDDLEDGDTQPFPVLGAHGGWFTANDGSGQQFPAPCAVSSPIENGQRAMHTYGGGFVSTAGGFSLLGLTLRTGEIGCEKGTDASRYTGVEFKARGRGWLRFFIGTTAVNPITDFGTCLDRCYDAHGQSVNLTPDWAIYRIPFRYLSQEGWGTPTSFDPSQILAIMWSAKVERGSIEPAGCFDFWIDDVAFYSE